MTATAPVTPARGPADPAAAATPGSPAAAGRVDQDPLGALHRLDAGHSSWWSCIGFTALIAWLTESHWFSPRAASPDASVMTDPVGFILGTGIGLGQLAICVLGVLVITSEYSTGVIRASLLAVPRRLPMLAAKAVVFAVLLLVVGDRGASARSSSARPSCTPRAGGAAATRASPAR